jgi:FtsZ-binding cell division protein ZapB
MRIISIAFCFVVLCNHPAPAQQVVVDVIGAPMNGCPSGYLSFDVGNLRGCKKYQDLSGMSARVDTSVSWITSLQATVHELTEKNQLLEKNLKTLSEAIDALTARLDKGERK